MVTGTSIFTLEEIARFAFPLGTEVAASGDSLQQSVRWVVTVHLDSPLPYLEGGELLLVVPGKADLQPFLDQFLDHCIQARVAALAIPAEFPPLALAAAEMAHLPVFTLPPATNIRELERLIVGLLLDRHDQVERRSSQVYQQLVQLVSENVGLEKLIQEISRYINKAVVMQDKHLRISHQAVTPELAGKWDDITEYISDRRNLPNTLQDRHRLPRHTSATTRQALGESGIARLISPIVTQAVGRGYLSFIGLEERFEDLDLMVINHAAVACALEMARAKAISEMEKKLRGDFLDGLLAGDVGESEALSEGDRFGHDMSVPHVAMVLIWYGSKHPSNRRLETLVNGMLSGNQIAALSRLKENELRLFCAADSTNPVQTARDLAERFRLEARREYPESKLAVGIGSVAARINDWRASYRDAAQAADIARRLGSEAPLFIGDLGIYTFLARPEFRDDLRALRDSTIGPLLQDEERNRADLLQTLEAFFQCHGNHTQTAEQLSVHRNTLFYRMNRIQEITRLDLNRPDVRLAVHLALKIHRLLTVET